MCLPTNQTKPLVAEKDITCYKVVYPASKDGVFCSEFRNFKYSLGTRYAEKRFPETPVHSAVHEGFHSYRTIEAARIRESAPLVLIRCVIPKGSRYYESYTGEQYCSDTLVTVAWKPLWKGKWSAES